MGKRLLSLDDLYDYYKNLNKNIHFSSSDDETNIVVQTQGDIHFAKKEKDIEGLRPVVLQACHTLKNANQSFISEKSMKSALPSFSNRPILANIIDVDGQPEFNTHAFHMDENDNIVYDEIPIGTIPESCDARLEYDEDKGRNYCVVNGYIFEEYAPVAIEILEREQECPCSVELSVRELSYDSKNKILNIDDFFFSGVTILGKTEDGEDVKPGMAGSNIKLADFSAENNSLFRAELIDDIAYAVIQRLSDKGDSPLFSKEGGNRVFNKLLEKYGKSVEDIKFDYNNMSDEELEEAFKVAFDDPEPEQETPSEPTDQDVADGVAALINALPVTVTVEDADQITAAREAYNNLTDAQKELITAEVLALLTGAETSLGEAQAAAANQTAATTVETAISALPSASEIGLEDGDAVDAARQAYESLTAAQKELVSAELVEALEAAVAAINTARSNNEDPAPRKKRRNELTYTVEIDGEVKTFSVSLVDKLNALSNLVNSTYAETDDAFYDVDAFDEEKYVIMHDYWRNKHYRQSYAVKKDVYSLKGDRVEVFARYLTNDEIAKLDNMKADYAVVTDKLSKYESEPEKVALLESEDYANIANSEGFVELKKQENHFDLTVDEVRAKADELLLEYAKHNTVTFSGNQIAKKVLPSRDKKKSGRYGNLFSK